MTTTTDAGAKGTVLVADDEAAIRESLAEVLRDEGYGVVRRFRYLIVGAGTKEEADELATRLHGEVEPSSAFVWENVRQNPFVVFGGLGGTGTPL